uniref:Uncharacterized protein n=1 Tax=Rhizophora mucronata TaxID=61149 RepID=A0A2P2PJG0_RHIMU
MLIHLLPSISFNCNMGHSLAFHFLTCLDGSWSLSLALRIWCRVLVLEILISKKMELHRCIIRNPSFLFLCTKPLFIFSA